MLEHRNLGGKNAGDYWLHLTQYCKEEISLGKKKKNPNLQQKQKKIKTSYTCRGLQG